MAGRSKEKARQRFLNKHRSSLLQDHKSTFVDSYICSAMRWPWAILISVLVASCVADPSTFNLPVALREIQTTTVDNTLIFSGFAMPARPLEPPIYFILQQNILTQQWTNTTLSTQSISIYGRTMIPLGSNLVIVTSGSENFDILDLNSNTWSQWHLPAPLEDCSGPSTRPVGSSLGSYVLWVHCGSDFLGYRVVEDRWMARPSEAGRQYVSAVAREGRIVFASVPDGTGEESGPFEIDQYDEIDDGWVSVAAPVRYVWASFEIIYLSNINQLKV
jgi:hypothetical protein